MMVIHPRGCDSVGMLHAVIGHRGAQAPSGAQVSSAILFPRVELRPPARERHGARAILEALEGFGAAIIDADGHGPPYPARASLARAAADPGGAPFTQTVDDGHGLTASGAGTVQNAPEGQSGSGFSLDVKATLTKQGVSATLANGGAMSAFVDSCPDGSGQVSGTARVSSSSSVAVSAADRSLSGTTTVEGTGAITGYVGNDGKLDYYDLVFDGSWRYEGPVRGLFGIGIADRHARSDVHMVFAHLVPGADISDEDLVRQINADRASGFGLGGYLDGAHHQALSALADDLLLMKGEADRALLSAQHYWYDDAACMAAAFSPQELQNAATGSVHPLTITVTDARDGQPPKLDATLSASHGSVTPTGAPTTAPIDARVTVSETPGDTTVLWIEGVSNRGRLFQSFHATVAMQLVLDYTYTSTASYSEPYDHSSGNLINYGTFSEQRNISLSSQIPLTEQGTAHQGSTGPNEHTYTGSAPLTWEQTSWSTENRNTTNEGQQYPSLCSSDNKQTMTAPFPGTATVSPFKIDINAFTQAVTANLALTLSGVHETWHENFNVTNGPCGSVVLDFDQAAFIADRIIQEGLFTNPGYVVINVNSGWQPGSGNTVATDTTSQTYQSSLSESGQGSVQATETYALVKQ